MKALVRRLELPVKLTFKTQPPLSIGLRKANPPICFTPCFCGGRDICSKKNVVYEIVCKVCGQSYIGETCRTLGSRIQEHIKGPTSEVYRHFMHSHKISPEPNRMSVKVLSTGHYDTGHRKATEKGFISERKPGMNTQH